MADLAIIDISRLFEDDRNTRRITDDLIGRAVFDTGGFVIRDYPDADKVDARAATMLSFFDLPDEVKRRVALRAMCPENERTYRGYIASFGSGDWAHNELFDIGPDAPVLGPPIPGMDILAEATIWPVMEPAPGWRATMRAYHDHMTMVATAVMLSVGRVAGFTNEDLQERFNGGNSTLRLLNYPTPPSGLEIIDELPDAHGRDPSDPPLSAGRHTDAAGVSLLWQQQAGLQAQAPDGRWRDVPQLDNCISVHLGDVLEIMTGGKVPATPHRVLDHGTARQSIGFFLEPALSARLDSLGAVPRASPAADTARGTYGWHLLRRIHAYKGFEGLVPYPQ